jgi:hypothetical protein
MNTAGLKKNMTGRQTMASTPVLFFHKAFTRAISYAAAQQ